MKHVFAVVLALAIGALVEHFLNLPFVSLGIAILTLGVVEYVYFHRNKAYVREV